VGVVIAENWMFVVAYPHPQLEESLENLCVVVLYNWYST